MRTRTSAVLFVLFFLLILLSAMAASANHIPDLVTIYLFDGTECQFYTDSSGTASYGGVDATWSVEDFSGTVHLAGSFDSPGNVDVFYIEWLGTIDVMPLSVTITSTTAGPYSIVPIFQLVGETEPDASMAREGVSGNTYFGHYFPECDKVSFAVYLDETATDYDVTLSMNWGTGVPNDAGTWGGIKTLFR